MSADSRRPDTAEGASAPTDSASARHPRTDAAHAHATAQSPPLLTPATATLADGQGATLDGDSLRSLRAERDRLRTILGSMAEGVVEMDFNGVVLGAYSVRCGGQAVPLRPGGNVRDLRDDFVVHLPTGHLVPFEQWPCVRMMNGLPVNDLLLRVRPTNQPTGGWYRYNGKVVHDAETGADRIVLTVRDETEIQNAATALRESEERFRAVFENETVGISMIRAEDGRFLSANRRMSSMLGYTPEELLELTFTDVTHPDDREADAAKYRQAVESGVQQYGMEKRYLCKDGATKWAWLEAIVRGHGEARPERSFGLVLDITARKLSEQLLRASEERFRAVFENAAVGIVITTAPGGAMRLVNDRFASMLGYQRDELVQRTLDEITHPDDRQKPLDGKSHALRDGSEDYEVEQRLLCKDGAARWVHLAVAVQRDKQGLHVETIAVAQDITDRKTAEENLRQSEASFRRLADAIPGAVWVLAPDGSVRYRNERSLLQTKNAEHPAGAPPTRNVHPDDVGRRNRVWRRSLRSGEPYECEMRVAMPDAGGYRWVLSRAVPVRDEQGQIEGWYGASTDIHDLKLAEQALQLERDRLLTMARVSPGVLNTLCFEPDGGVTLPYASPTIEQLLGISLEQLQNDRSALERVVHPDDLPALRRVVLQAIRAYTGWSHQFRVRHPELGELWLEGRYAHGGLENGAVIQHGVLTDITQSRRIADQLRETQKMKAIGRLAGGIAHDFNNLLAVILGEAELALEAGETSAATHEAFSAIAEAAGKASALTRQLLTFSRRQPHAPRLLDLNQQITALGNFIDRVLGDSVRCERRLCDAPTPVHADPAQIEQAVLNLVINARDAMANGGLLTIASRVLPKSCVNRDEPSGPWVELSFADNGPGIPDEVLGRVFEPFFTTKEVHKGTGLGLAVVHGIAEQNGGAVFAESPRGGGATFRLLLPVATAPA